MKQRVINIYCPCLSKIVSIRVWEEQRLDLGSISASFGLDPTTVKLNGHFISRGLDLIASSVTWKSLLSYFSARAFSTGDSSSTPVIVDGKLSKVGTKRSHGPTEVEEGVPCKELLNDEREKSLDNTNSLSSKRFKENTRGVVVNLKRKLCLGDSGLLKRTRTNEYDPGLQVDFPEATSDRPLLCSLTCEKVKRVREDEMVVTVPMKRKR